MFGFKKELYTPEYQLAGDECAVIETSKGTIKVKILSEWECKRKTEARDTNAIGLEIEKGPRSKPEAFQSPRAQKQA